MFEITNFIKLEITVIESGRKHENVLPYGAADKKELVEKVKKLLDCDDVQIKDIKQFPIDEEELSASKKNKEDNE